VQTPEPPYYRLDADGENETGFSLYVQVENGAGGPLEGMTGDSLMGFVRDHLAASGANVVTSLTYNYVTSNTL
jgi:hypothetical protein